MPFDSLTPWIETKTPAPETKTEVPPAPVLSVWARARNFLAAIPWTAQPATLADVVNYTPPPPPPPDARVVALRAALEHVGKSYIPDIIKEHATSPAAFYGALEALSKATGHPMHSLGFHMRPSARYSCDMRCMSPGVQERAINKAIRIIEADPTRTVR